MAPQSKTHPALPTPPVTFPPNSVMTPQKTHTCQCTQCRKRSGALTAPYIDTLTTHVHWSTPSHHPTTSPTTLPSFAEYSASAGKHRGFCTTCGSPLTFRSDDCPGEVEVTTGSLDEEVLAGEMGKVVGRASGGHFWCERMIAGVTDLEGGRRFRAGGGSEEVGK